MRVRLQPGKTEYTEAEATRALGVSPAEFRSLLQRHFLENEEALGNVAIMRFRPSDLLLLSLFDKEKDEDAATVPPSDS
ncbi:MAG: hypothetical protein HY238_20755 [Acidobacteria bacterium]|nr:hypothetical protein [Acidobacteriota bacterium]